MQPSVRDLSGSIASDWRTLLMHINDLGRLLVRKKSVCIALRVGTAVLCTAVLLFVRLHSDNQPIVGDQPHYVLMEYSLVHDHDFNLANNFAHHDSDTFGIYPPHGLMPDGQVGPGQVRTPTHQYSIHNPGLPLLLWPGYMMGHITGMEVEMVLISVAVLYLTYYWSKAITKSIRLSFIAGAALFISYVFYGLAGYIFPDMVIGAVIVASLLIITKKYDSYAWQVLLGLLLGSGIFLHYKMFSFAAVAFLALCYKTWTKRRTLPYAAAVPLAVLSAIFLYLTHKWFGIWNPSGVLADLGVGLHPESLPKNASAILFDAARGFIPNNPLFLLLFVGLPIWFRKSRETFIVAILCILPQIGTFVLFNDWRGGDSPAGRYIMNFLPVLLPTVAFSLQYLKKAWERVVAIALFAVTALITGYYIKIKLGWLGVDSPISSPILKGTRLAFDRWFPQFDVATNPTGRLDWLKALTYYIVLIGLVIYGYVISKRILTPKNGRRREIAAGVA